MLKNIKSLLFKRKKQVKMKKVATPYKSQLCETRSFKEKNAKFRELSRKDKAREVALDALQLLLNSKIQAQAGLYWNQNLHSQRASLTTSCIKKGKKIGSNLHKLKVEEGCTVCARGAMMLSGLRNCDMTDILNQKRSSIGGRLFRDDRTNESDVSSGNSALFDELGIDGWNAAENVFEHNWDDDYCHPYQRGTQENLANILCNIVQNGKFELSDTTDYVKQWNLKVPKGNPKYIRGYNQTFGTPFTLSIEPS